MRNSQRCRASLMTLEGEKGSDAPAEGVTADTRLTDRRVDVVRRGVEVHERVQRGDDASLAERLRFGGGGAEPARRRRC